MGEVKGGAAEGGRMKPSVAGKELPEGAGLETVCVHWGELAERFEGAAAAPIFQTSTFVYPDMEALAGHATAGSERYIYSRVNNPTNQILEAKLARLEKAAWADAFGSGMAAITAAVNSQVKAGDHIVAVDHCYRPARQYFEHLRRFGVETTYVGGAAVEDFAAAMRAETRVLYLESPTSGWFEVIDIAALTTAARERGVVTIFDNSWASPVFCNPLELGADLVVHSVTKYLNGHSDVVAGVVAGNDERLRERLWKEVELCGGMLDPHAAWLVLRGLRTLGLRMERHEASGLAVARWLEGHPAVLRVHHPGLESHAGYEVGRGQFRGYSGLFSFELKGGAAAVERLIGRVRLFGLGVSWGGYESLILGGTMYNTREEGWLVRVSVGLETVGDLIGDLGLGLG